MAPFKISRKFGDLDPPPNAESRISWVNLMALEKLDDTIYRSLTPPPSPAGLPQAFGGHVYAQSVYAASHTIRPGFYAHNVTGYWILPGDGDFPFVYTVRIIREGGGYCVRGIDVRQPTPDVDVTNTKQLGLLPICFTSIVSFKTEEESSYEYQEHVDLRERYKEVVEGMMQDPLKHPVAPGVDSPWYWEWSRENNIVNTFAGSDVRKVDMDPYNSVRPLSELRQLQFYRTIGDLPVPKTESPSSSSSASPTSSPPLLPESTLTPSPPSPPPLLKPSSSKIFPEAPYDWSPPLNVHTLSPPELHLHLCLHLFASDRNGLFIISNGLGLGNNFSRMASLSHTIVFHVRPVDLLAQIPYPSSSSPQGRREGGKENQDRWFLQEFWFDQGREGRTLLNSKIWSWDFKSRKHVHLASTFQDGLLRGGTRRDKDRKNSKREKTMDWWKKENENGNKEAEGKRAKL